MLMRQSFFRIASAVCAAVLLTGCDGPSGTGAGASGENESGDSVKLSEFGRYQGYSEPKYTEYVRSSVYVPMRDGVRLAVDIYRPSIDGVAADEPMPVVFSYSRYPRARMTEDGSIIRSLFGFGTIPPGEKGGPLPVGEFERPAAMLMRHGYVYAVAEARGTGASFGVYAGNFSGTEARDGYDLVEWLGAQSFSNGKVGMLGNSYVGTTQLLVASERPPSLKAIAPHVSVFDNYRSFLSGAGVFKKVVVAWTLGNADRDDIVDGAGDVLGNRRAASSIAPVDEDVDGAMLAEALAERKAAGAGDDAFATILASDPSFAMTVAEFGAALGHKTPLQTVAVLFNAEALGAALREHPSFAPRIADFHFTREIFGDGSYNPVGPNDIVPVSARLNETGVPVYYMGGWRDVYARDTLLAFANSATPRKLLMGPWTHAGGQGDPRECESRRIRSIEHLRWFDYWLKGVDNAIMQEPAVNYAIIHDLDAREWDGAPDNSWTWTSAPAWPPQNASTETFYLAPGGAAPAISVNDGALASEPPQARGKDNFTVDYQSTIGPKTRYGDAFGYGPLTIGDLAEHSAAALTYTTPPLEEDLVLVGAPVVTLEATSSSSDGEFNAYLQQVRPDGRVDHLGWGTVRASHRQLAQAPYDTLNMPYTDSRNETVKTAPPLNSGPAMLTFELSGHSNRFKKGSRIRLVVTGADAVNNFTPPILPAPTQSVFTGGPRASRLELPVVNEVRD